MLQQAHHRILASTRGPGFTDLTAQVAHWLGQIGADAGLLTIFVRHTSASLTIQENADPDVQRDLLIWLEGAAPRARRYH
ncbi:MAG: YjbQ family protein, partial [Hyphomicrobiaceae bacterium]